jgi:hypothetical protein
MGAFYETLPPSLITWLLAQKVFWIASAPLAGDGHVNVSPKGISDKGGPFFGVIKETLSAKDGKILPVPAVPIVKNQREQADDTSNIVIRKFWYMDLTGSGIETTSHLHEPGNGRITVMFNAFEGPPRILRIFGKGMSIAMHIPLPVLVFVLWTHIRQAVSSVLLGYRHGTPQCRR